MAAMGQKGKDLANHYEPSKYEYIIYIYTYTIFIYIYISYTWGTSNRELEYITDRTEPSNRKIEMTHPIFIDNLVNVNHSWI